MSLNKWEQEKARDGMHQWRLKPCTITTHDWRFYFSYLLGREVTIQETIMFLKVEAEAQV